MLIYGLSSSLFDIPGECRLWKTNRKLKPGNWEQKTLGCPIPSDQADSTKNSKVHVVGRYQDQAIGIIGILHKSSKLWSLADHIPPSVI